MKSDLSARAHALLTEALEIDDDAARREHVSDACAGDDALARRMDSLLLAAEQSGAFLERPALESCDLPPAPPPSSIGGYRIEGVLGAGGMATVYEAVQERPSRRVALKVLRLALTHTSAVERFRYETDILARLHHPFVAQIYDAGAIDDGHGVSTPYFAMEFIPDAAPITAHCQRAALTIRERIALFLDVCDAVQHGHNLGVIHRDIKPANVLVGGDGRPKVIDFGVAKTTDPQRPNLTLESTTESIVGTLRYMSPEQRAGEELDTRTDVYSLGILLYEMLSGRPPYERARTDALDAPPKRPSAHAPELAGDPDVIALKALEHDRERRYPTVNALAGDLRRYLASEPILARPASTLYQARMFARRRRPLVVAAAAVLLSLLVGIAATTYMALEATAARRATEARERELERVVDFQTSQLGGIDVAAMGATLRDELASRAPDAAPIDDVNFTSIALKMLEEDLLERSREAIATQFADEPLLRARLLQTLAGTMNDLGLPENAERVLDGAMIVRRDRLGPDHPDTLTTQHAIGAVLAQLGRHDEAVITLRDVYERRARVFGPEHPETLRAGSTLGGALRYLGDFDGAARVWEDTLAASRRALGPDHPETLRVLNNIGVIYALQGDNERATVAVRELLDQRARRIGTDHPLYLASLTNLGLLLHDQGDLEGARDCLDQSLSSLRANLGDEHPSTLSTMGSLGTLLVDMGDHAEGERLLREALEGRYRILGEDHPRTLRSRTDLAIASVAQGRAGEAVRELEAVLPAFTASVGRAHPLTLMTMQALAQAHLSNNEPSKALGPIDEAIARAAEAGLLEHASGAEFHAVRARVLSAIGDLENAVAARKDAHRVLSRALGEQSEPAREAAQHVVEALEAQREAHPAQDRSDEITLWRERAREKSSE